MAELLLHPSDTRTGIAYSLIPMTQAIIGGAVHARAGEPSSRLIADHLVFPDGVRLMDKPVAYQAARNGSSAGPNSAAYFGREIGLMYVHAHLRYCEALGHASATGDGAVDARSALVNPIAVTQHLGHASLRQRNTYFSCSDAAFRDRYRASAEWGRVSPQGRLRWTAAGGSIRAARASTPTFCCGTPSAGGAEFGDSVPA